MDDRSVAQVAPSGNFNNVSTFNCANPFLSAAELTAFCGGSTVGQSATEVIARRDVEGGDRQSSLEHTDFREVLGVKGKIDDVWTYDASWQYSMVDLQTTATNYFSTTKLTNALNVTGTAANPVCISGPPCVPYNMFQTGAGVTPAALAYLYSIGIENGRITQMTVDGNITGDLEKYGVKLPTAQSGLKLNMGVEWRDTKDFTLPDEEIQTGDLAGTGGPVPPVSGGIVSREVFMEARMPIMDNMPGAQSLAADASYRYSDYSLGFKTNTYEFGVEWAPVDEVRLRGSFARAVRAPNVVELFSPAAVGLDSSIGADPCSGTHPVYTPAECARTGVTTQYGHILANPAGQYNGLLGGDPALLPETALTTSFGIGWTPSFIPHFRVQVDYYDIKIENVIQSIGAANILTQCATNNVLCNLIHRDANGSLWETNAGFITDTNLNVGKLQEQGIDLDMSYAFDIGAFGAIHTSFVGTYIDEYDVTPIAASPATQYNCAGYYGATCSSSTTGAGTPIFHWRNRFSTTWLAPWDGLSLTASWRFMSAVKLESLSPNSNIAAPAGATIANGGISNTDAYLSSRNYLDLSAAMKVGDKVTVRVGVQNVFDKDPPLIGTTDIPGPPAGNGNTFPGTYDSLGRYIFGQVTAQF